MTTPSFISFISINKLFVFFIFFPINFDLNFNITTFISAGTALIVTPIISIITKDEQSFSLDQIWMARKTSDEEAKEDNIYNIIPKTFAGKFSLGILFAGLIIFLAGVFAGSEGIEAASIISVTGMIIYFAGGLIRTYTN